MFGKNKKGFFSEPAAGKTAKIDDPMLTKEEQKSYQMKKNQNMSLYDSENVIPFVPDSPFVLYNTIKNQRVRVFKHDIQFVNDEKNKLALNISQEANNDDLALNRKVRCQHCAAIHSLQDSLCMPTYIYEKNGKKYIEGTGHFDSFECLYRVILDNIPFFNHTSPVLYQNSKYYTQILFSLMYPNEILVPAPRLDLMEAEWCGKYTMIRLPGHISSRNIAFYEIRDHDLTQPVN